MTNQTTPSFQHALDLLSQIREYDQIPTADMSGDVWGTLADEAYVVVKELGRELEEKAQEMGLDIYENQDFPDLVDAAVKQGLPSQFCQDIIADAWATV